MKTKKRIFLWNLAVVGGLALAFFAYDSLNPPNQIFDPGWALFCWGTAIGGMIECVIGCLLWLFSIHQGPSRWFILAGLMVTLIGGSVCALPALL